MTRLLLLSGGLDSAAVAAWQRPDHCLVVDYGQAPAGAEARAAEAIARDLGLGLTRVTVDASQVGAGLMSNTGKGSDVSDAAEWWPFRNQLLITIAGAWAVVRGYSTLLFGTVASDARRHADGAPAFFDAVSRLLEMQEGRMSVAAPAATMSSKQLVELSGVSDQVLAWTHSCHLGDIPCGRCPGCVKRSETLKALGRLQ